MSKNYRISDQKSFTELCDEPHQVAGLYFYSVLDCLVDLAYKISYDFYNRPHLYLDLNGSGGLNSAQLLATLHGRYGYDEKFLGKEQRHQIYAGIFGAAGGYGVDSESLFARLRNDLLNACAAFAERVYDTGVEMLRTRVRDAHRPIHEYLTGMLGDSIRWSRDQALAEITENISYQIMRSKGVAAVFGISAPPKEAWPYIEDSNGDKLVEEIYRQLKAPHLAADEESAPMPLTRERMSNLQRTALRGAEAIAVIIDFDERSTAAEDVDLLILKCYSWGSALLTL